MNERLTELMDNYSKTEILDAAKLLDPPETPTITRNYFLVNIGQPPDDPYLASLEFKTNERYKSVEIPLHFTDDMKARAYLDTAGANVGKLWEIRIRPHPARKTA